MTRPYGAIKTIAGGALAAALANGCTATPPSDDERHALMQTVEQLESVVPFIADIYAHADSIHDGPGKKYDTSDAKHDLVSEAAENVQTLFAEDRIKVLQPSADNRYHLKGTAFYGAHAWATTSLPDPDETITVLYPHDPISGEVHSTVLDVDAGTLLHESLHNTVERGHTHPVQREVNEALRISKNADEYSVVEYHEALGLSPEEAALQSGDLIESMNYVWTSLQDVFDKVAALSNASELSAGTREEALAQLQLEVQNAAIGYNNMHERLPEMRDIDTNTEEGERSIALWCLWQDVALHWRSYEANDPGVEFQPVWSQNIFVEYGKQAMLETGHAASTEFEKTLPDSTEYDRWGSPLWYSALGITKAEMQQIVEEHPEILRFEFKRRWELRREAYQELYNIDVDAYVEWFKEHPGWESKEYFGFYPPLVDEYRLELLEATPKRGIEDKRR